MRRCLLLWGTLALPVLPLLQAQQRSSVTDGARPSRPALGDAALAKKNALRFLAERGLTGRHLPGRTLSSARRATVSALRGSPSPQVTSLTAPWQAVGPAQVSTANYGLVTGRVTALAADPSDASGNTLYLGSTGGGVWKSIDAAGTAGSATFAPLTDTLNVYSATAGVSLSIGALSVQPGGTGVLLAGTGDPNDATDSYYGAGILRSTDGGLTWSLIDETDDLEHGGNANYSFVGSSFAGFAWSTLSSGTVVAAVTSSAEGQRVGANTSTSVVMGLFYSQDSGQTWQLATITDGGGNTIQAEQGPVTGAGNAATAVVWNPIRKMFFAAVRYHGYYQSPDGITWTRMANQPGSGLTITACPTNFDAAPSTTCPVFRGALAVQPVTGDLFALTVDNENQDQGLFRDTCNAASPTPSSCPTPVSWSTQIPDQPLEAGNGDATIPQADYNLVLAAVPSQQDTLLFVGTQDLFRCSLANACVWRNTTNDATCMAAGVAPAQHAIDATAAAKGILYFGNDGGLWRTTDQVNQQQAACSSDDATHFQNLNGGLGSLAEVENIAQDGTNSANLMASLGALGTAAPQVGVTAWQQVLDGYGSAAAINAVAPEYWFATSEFGVGVNRCTDGSGCDEAGFSSVVIGNADVSGDGDAQIIPAPWILDPQNPANVILATCRVWRGVGTGGWSSGSNLLSGMLDGDQSEACNGNAEVRTLAASGSSTDAPGAAEQVYAGMAGARDGGEAVAGHIFSASVTSSSGASTTWSDLSNAPVDQPAASSGIPFNPGGFDLSSIVVDTHDATGNTVYVTVQGFGGSGVTVAKIYRSVDGGAHWQNLTSNLPNAPANSVAVDPNDANVVYVALDTGVWVATNVSDCLNVTDNCWSLFGTGLPNAPPVQLAVFNQGDTQNLRVATYGRGIWQIPLISAGTALGAMSVTPTSLNFPSEAVSTLSAPQQVLMKNTGSLSLTFSQIVTTGDFTESDTCTGGPIAPGYACVVEVYFLPSATGARSGVLTLYANVPGGQATVQLAGTGLAAPAIVLNPVQVVFPDTLVGATSPASNVTVSNTGGATATLSAETVTGDFAITANTCGSTLAANTGCTLSLVFSPAVSGSRAGVLTVTANGASQPTVLTSSLTGVGQQPPTDALSATSLTFAAQTVGTVSASQQVTLTNNGDQALQLITAQVSGPFQIINNCGTSLAGHSGCAILVLFVPISIGPQQGTLTIGDALRAQTVSLSGTGTAPPGVSATPSTVNFGDYGVGASSPSQPVTLTNNGASNLSGLQYAVTGDFSVAQSSGGCGAELDMGASCQIGVVFSPTAVGTRSGQLSISGVSLSSPLSVQLNGNGVDFMLQVSGASSQTVTSGQTATFMVQVVPVGGSTGSVALSCSGAPQNAACSVNPASVTLSGASTASATVTVTTGSTSSSANILPTGKASPLMLALTLPWLLALRRRRALLALLASALLVGLAACGVTASSGAVGGGGGGSGGSTASGTYTLTMTGTAAGITKTLTLSLTVE